MRRRAALGDLDTDPAASELSWYLEMDAVELAEAIRSRSVSSVEAVEAALGRIAETDESLNACFIVLEREARAAARAADRALASADPAGQLHGVPVIVKDAIWVRGVPATMGCRALADFVPEEDAVVVRRLRAAGAIVVAKSANAELLWNHQADGLHGVTRNPWSTSRTASGSSGGSAAAVAAGMAPIALGTDAGGSVRSPAAVCGIVGLKPTHGLVPRTPGFEEMRTTNVFGTLTRTVRDAAVTLNVLAGPDHSDDLSLAPSAVDFFAGLDRDVADVRMAWVPDAGSLDAADASVRAVVCAAIDRLVRAGWRLDTMNPELPDVAALAYPILVGELGALVDGREQLLSAVGRDLVEASHRLSARDYYVAQLERAQFTAAWDRFFDGYDVVLLPSVPRVAPEVGSSRDDQEIKAVSIANLTRRPAMSVPIGLTEEGLPVGLEIMCRRGADAMCLTVAAAIERLAPWPRLAHDNRPGRAGIGP